MTRVFKAKKWLAALAIGALTTFGIAELDPTAAHGASCTKSWAAAVSGQWTLGTNWTPLGVPGPSDVVCISQNGTYTVTVASVAASVAALDIGSGTTSGSQKMQISSASFASSGGISIGTRGVVSVGLATDGQNSTLSGAIVNNGVLDFPVGSGQTLAGSLINNAAVNTGSANLTMQSPLVWTNVMVLPSGPTSIDPRTGPVDAPTSVASAGP